MYKGEAQNVTWPGKKEREARTSRIVRVARLALCDLIELGLITEDSELHKGMDPHMFLQKPNEPDKIIHIQLSSEKPNRIGLVDIRKARVMDKAAMLKARELGSIGSENRAVLNDIQGATGPILLSRRAITSFLEQILDPEFHKRPFPYTS